MQSNNHPAAPDSFERSRLADLVKLHEAIATLGQAPDYMAVIEQRSALYDSVRASPYADKYRGSFGSQSADWLNGRDAQGNAWRLKL